MNICDAEISITVAHVWACTTVCAVVPERGGAEGSAAVPALLPGGAREAVLRD